MGADIRSRVKVLHDISAELETLDSESEIYEHAIDAVDRVLTFDDCALLSIEDDVFEVKSAVASELHVDAQLLQEGEGIAGRTLRSQQTHVVSDIHDEPDARPTDEEYRSVLSIPVTQTDVFQALSSEADTFSDADREVAELLTTQVEHALNRVRYEQAITEERDRFVALFENVPDAALQYVIEDGPPRIEDVNAAFARLFGYEPAEAVGKTTMELLVPENERENAEGLYDDVRAGARLDTEVERGTSKGLRPFLLRSVPVTTYGASREGYFIYTDIAEMRARERKLARQNERLDGFASIVSHDLRNPLSIAQGYVSQARETGEIGHLDEVEDALDRMERMIAELLTLAREGQKIDDVTAVDLEKAVRTAWKHVTTGDAELTIEGTTTIRADAERLQHVLENLFRNAVEHSSTSPGSQARQDAVEHGSTSNRPEADDAVEHGSTSPQQPEGVVEH